MVIALNSLLHSALSPDHRSYLIIHVIFVLQQNTNYFIKVRYFDEVSLLCTKKKKFRVHLNFLHDQNPLKVLLTIIFSGRSFERPLVILNLRLANYLERTSA